MGYARTLFPDLTQKHRWKIFWSFLVISLSVVIVSTYSSYQKEAENRQQWDRITGGDSFPIFVPQSNSGDVPLVMWNWGNAILSGVIVTIKRGDEFSQSSGDRMAIGAIAPHAFVEIPKAISPQISDEAIVIDGAKVTTFVIETSAQNGNYVQTLQFKKGDDCPQGTVWTYRFSIDKWAEVGRLPGADKPTIIRPTKRLYLAPADPNGWIGSGKCP
jgi:hypothetical protein